MDSETGESLGTSAPADGAQSSGRVQGDGLGAAAAAAGNGRGNGGGAMAQSGAASGQQAQRASSGNGGSPRRLTILGHGEATPTHSITYKESAAYAVEYLHLDDEQKRLLPAFYRMSGVKTRGSVLLEEVDGGKTMQNFFPKAKDAEDQGPGITERMKRYEEEAPKLARQSASNALEASGVDPKEITHMVTVSCSGFNSPGVDIDLINYLGLSPTVERVHVGFMGCHGALNGMRVVRGITESNPNATVLMCAVEICSLHYNYPWDPEKVVANALFADGSATIIARGTDAGTSGDAWQVRNTGSCLIPNSEDAMQWLVRNNGFEIGLAPTVPELISSHLKRWVEGWLADVDMKLEDIQTWAVHPGGPRILMAAAEALGLEKQALEVSRGVLRDYGNMSSPTILFILNRLRQQNAPRPCVALAFGPGLMAEGVLFE